jgi:hypothetical protein
MGALTETAGAITEFSGQVKCWVGLINPGAATGTVTIDEFDTILGVFVTLAEDSAATCCGYSCTVSTNVVTLKGIEGDGTVCSGSQLDFYLLVIGYNS